MTVLVRITDHELGGHHTRDRRVNRIEPPVDDALHDIALGKHAHQRIGIDNGHDAHVVSRHQAHRF